MKGGLAKDKNFFLKKLFSFFFFLFLKERVRQRGAKKEGPWVKKKI
jgi:hypothetical protein